MNNTQNTLPFNSPSFVPYAHPSLTESFICMQAEIATESTKGAVKAASLNEKKGALNNALETRKVEMGQTQGQIGDQSSNNTVLKIEIANTNDKIKRLLEEKSGLESILTSNYISIEEKPLITIQINAIENEIAGHQSTIEDYQKQIEQNNAEIAELKAVQDRLSSLQIEDSKQIETLKAQISNTQEGTQLKINFIAKKRELKKCNKYDIKPLKVLREIATLESEIKTIIKTMIHVEMLDKLKQELERKHDFTTISELNKQVAEEVKKTQLRQKLEEAKKAENKEAFDKLQSEITAITLKTNALLNKISEKRYVTELENRIKETKEELKQVEEELAGKEEFLELSKTYPAEIDANVLTKAIQELNATIQTLKNKIAELTKELSEKLGVTTAPATPSTQETIIGEFKKWLVENMATNGIEGDWQEVAVSLFLFYWTSKNTDSATTGQDATAAEKIKNLATGAAKKFCMSQVLQALASTNPAFSAIYGIGIIAQHCLLGDAQMATLISEVKTFAIGEVIKAAGIAALGGAMGTGFAPVAAATVFGYGVYKAATAAVSWAWGGSNNTTTTTTTTTEAEATSPSTVKDMAEAGLDFLADETIKLLWEKAPEAIGMLV